MLFAVAKNGIALKKRAFWSSFLCFSNAGNLASPPHLLLKEYCAGFGLEESDTIGWRFRSANFGRRGSMEALGIFLPGVSNEIEAEFNTRT